VCVCVLCVEEECQTCSWYRGKAPPVCACVCFFVCVFVRVLVVTDFETHRFLQFFVSWILIRWPKIWIIRIGEFVRTIRIIRIDEILNSILSKFWTPQNSYFAFFRVSRIFSWNLSDEMEISEKSTSHGSNHKLCTKKRPNKPLDDANNICKSSNTWTISEFLMKILRKFCDATTFHHLWDH